jgi:predicted CxxxxCH...CXXCH cytochrome family protein
MMANMDMKTTEMGTPMNFLTASTRGARILILTALVLLTLAAGSAFAGANTYSSFTSAGGPLAADGSQQTVATVTSSQGAGGATVTSFTILLGGTVSAGDVTGVYFTNGANTWSATGSYGSGSSVVCIGSAKPGASTYSINVTLAGSAAGKTVSVQVTTETPASGGTGIPTATSSALSISAPPASNSYGTLSSAGGPLTANGSQQTVATVPVTAVNGGATVSSYTVNLSGTVTAGDVTGVYVTDGSSTWSSTGSYGNGSSVVCTGANAIPGATLTIKVTMTASADTKTVGVTLQTDSNGASTLPKGPSTALLITAPAGPSGTLTDCGSCHDYPPADSATRGTPEGAVVGDHQVHLSYTCNFCHEVPPTEDSTSFAHRDGIIKMKFNTIGDAGIGDNGNYSRETGSGFAQSNNPTTGTCSNVECHYNNVTPQWGVGTTDCASCHGAPPNSNAHFAHYTAKGWTNPDTAGANCATCHPGDHDGIVEVNAGLAYAANSCSTPGGLGCHNDYPTPDWTAGGAVCTDCHSAGGANAADPVSGLHDVVPAVSGQQHNESIAGGCVACHSAVDGAASHVNGLFTGDTVANLGLAAAINYTQSAADTGTCVNTSCHVSNSDAWEHKWDSTAGVYTTDVSACDGCHGDWMGSNTAFNTGVDHKNTAGIQLTHGDAYTNYVCGECHVIEATTNNYNFTFSSGDWRPADGTSNHGNGTIDINTGGSYNTSTNLCQACHLTVDGTHNFVDTAWSVTAVAGDGISASCTTCHGGGMSGSTSGTKNMWPDDSTGHAANTAGRHAKHMQDLAFAAGFGTLDDLLNDGTADTKQKALCEYCHAADTNDSDHMNTYPADVFVDADSVRHAKSLWGAADANAAYSAAADTCSNVDCHNSKLTTDGTFGWYDAGTSTCTLCHTVGGAGANPNSGLHNLTAVGTTAHDDNFGTGYGCTDCHQVTPSSSHIDGTTQSPSTATFNFDLTGKTITLNAAADNTDDTCTAATCHSDGGDWDRQWSTAADSTATAVGSARCVVCHGQFGNWRTGTSHAAAFDNTRGNTHNTLTGATNGCEDCHVYPSVSVNHQNNKITINNAAAVASAGGRTWCGPCHTNDGAPGTSGTHTFEQSGFTRETVAGANDPVGDCNACHKVGGSGAIVTPTSSHVKTTRGGAFNACTDCHPGGAVGTMHAATGVIAVANNATAGIDISYVDGVNGGGAYSGYAGIVLGGDAAAPAASEAQWCWGCHDGGSVAASEWNKTWGAYQTGTMTSSNWTTGQWASANFAYKTDGTQGKDGTIESTHGVNGGTAGLDALSNISCTYCHDVHDTGGGTNNGAKPFLRGSWISNPFKEDGAPQTTAHATVWGGVPRAGLGSAQLGNSPNAIGGWQIEQNNPGAYTRTGVYGTFAGLCQSCHSQTNLEAAWSGHAAAVDGFSNAGAANIFTRSKHGGTTSYLRANMQHQLVTTTQNGTWVYGLRESRDGTGISPQTPTDPTLPNMQAGTTGYNWAANMKFDDTATPDADFHGFPCAKCHNPHASRLPRLMITNCLDVRHNKWDDGQGNPSLWSNGSDTYTAKQLAYSPTAVNCHRYVASGDTNRETNASGETGWNLTTPW